MNSRPSTPVRIPKAAGTYTLSVQDPELRSEINNILINHGHMAKIHESLLHTLHASPTNWPTLIQEHALALLRNNTCTTFPELMARVMSDIKHDTLLRQQGDKATNGAAANGTQGKSFALPENVVAEGLKVTREALDDVAAVDE